MNTTLKHKVSAVIITYNSAETIDATLKALSWCNEIIVVDSGSTDNTKEICSEYTDKFFYHQFEGYGPQKQYASSLSENDWILSIDSDEVLSEGLQKELKTIFSQDSIHYSGFKIPITFVFMGKVFKYGQESHGSCLRVFNRRSGGFDNALVHEKIHLEGKVKTLKNPAYHYSHRDIAHYLSKLNSYTSYSAETACRRNKTCSKILIILKLPATFFIKYFIRLNILNGFEGFVWSVNSSYYSFIKHLKFYEKIYIKNR